MAQRFGGPNSPDNARRDQPSKGARVTVRPSPVGLRVNLLFALPFLWGVGAFFRDPAGLAQSLAVFALLMLAAWLTREGVLAHDAWEQRRVARRPAIPRKIFASVITGLALALAGWGNPLGLAVPVIFGGIGGLLHLLSFGPDPLRDKGMEGVDEFQNDRVARAVEGAEAHLVAMSDAILRARDRGVEQRLTQFQTHARALLRAVEDDPTNLSSARRYLGVYLQGARDATVKFVELFERERNPQARIDYIALLDDLEENFMLRTETLRDNDRQQLDIEIDVLRERLDREGLRRPPTGVPTP